MEVFDDSRMLGAYKRDELNNNGKRLLSLASDNKLALTNTFFSARRSGLSHTFNSIHSRNDRKQIDYILTPQAHRPRVYDIQVHPRLRLQPRRIQTITSYTRWSALAVVLPPTDAYVRKTKSSLSTGRSFDLRVVARIISKLPGLPLQPNSISEIAESFTKVILDAVEIEVAPPTTSHAQTRVVQDD